MELEELVGKHKLTGVDQGSVPVKEKWGDGFEDCDSITFRLDGVTYQAVEDPQDGWRSCMRELKVVPDDTISNRFEACEVMCIMAANTTYEVNEVLECYDATNGKIVLRVGTRNTDDYYPVWVAEFIPENMAVNSK